MVLKQDFSDPTQECNDYQPIQFLKNFTEIDNEIAEDAGCDTCVHHRNNCCEIYLK